MERVTLAFKLSEITLDPRLDMRAGREQVTIDDYAEHIFDLPPGKGVKGPNGEIWLTDGWTRYKAHEKMSQKTMRLAIKDGTYLEALAEAAGSNFDHGVRRTDADKRRAVRSLLLEPAWSDKTSRVIAEASKTSHTFVEKVRARLAEAEQEQARKKGRPNKGESPRPKRVGKDGKRYKSSKARCSRCQRVCGPGQSVPNCPKCKELQTQGGQDAPPEREVLKDAANKIVPAHLEPIFELVPIFREGAQICRRLKDILKAIEASPHKKKRLTKEHFEAMSVVALRLSQKIDDLCPHIAVHGICDGNGCKTCQNDGWQSQEEYKAEKATL